jgi:hypothetical protein
MPHGRWRRAPAADFMRKLTIDQQGEAVIAPMQQRRVRLPPPSGNRRQRANHGRHCRT